MYNKSHSPLRNPIERLLQRVKESTGGRMHVICCRPNIPALCFELAIGRRIALKGWSHFFVT